MTPHTGIRSYVATALEPTLAVASGLTLMLLALYSGGSWTTRVPIAVFCTTGLVFATLRQSPWFWLPIALLLSVTVLPNLYTRDNHKVLMALWSLAVLGAMAAKDEEGLRIAARWMIGLAFLFATVWKVIAPDFLNGAFIEFTLLTDNRFRGFTSWTTGFPSDLDIANRESLSELSDSVRFGNDTGAQGKVLNTFPAIQALAVCITWYTVLLEGAIAVTFLGSGRVAIFKRARNALCLMFLLTTYAVATVIGFGWLLALMGYTQCESHERQSRLAFVAAFLLLQVFLVPWDLVLSDIVGVFKDGGAQ
jgi:hypothetical protein